MPRLSAIAKGSLRRVWQYFADPGIEVGQRAGAQRLLLRAARGAAAERREQAEIHIHRLKGARAGIDRFDMAAGDMADQRAVRSGRRWQIGRSPSRSAAAKRPASKPIAADST